MPPPSRGPPRGPPGEPRRGPPPPDNRYIAVLVRQTVCLEICDPSPSNCQGT